ncbi:hypothetical protein OS493_018540 [Desmophyllum pertusum]|uniref:Vertnin n=1 Tax=Desmophyllum pertusum TaxID=174260 RepID=A0A9X0A236_9CNID|nr:hypothetical protein OS493_018540 [Desmophyllum pertusum]
MARQDLTRLQGSCNDFRKFCSMCEEMERRWSLHALNVNDIDLSTSQFASSQVDEISRRIIPPNCAGLSYVPVRSTGDGNCLFNSASLAICQNESLAVELRLRTCFELAKNREFYRRHPVLVNTQIDYTGRHGPGVMSVETLCDLTCFASSSSNVQEKQGFEAAFNNEIMRTAENYSYSGTLQIMALASVLGVPVETVYPDQKHRLLPVYQNVYKPRQCSNRADSAVVRILWTSTRGWPDRSKEFVVNHFVPLLKLNGEASTKQSTATTSTKPVNPWHIFTKKRRSKQMTEKQESEKQSNKKTKANDENKGKQYNRWSYAHSKVKTGKEEKPAKESKRTENRESRKPSPMKPKLTVDDTSKQHTSHGNSENAKVGTDKQGCETREKESLENQAK